LRRDGLNDTRRKKYSRLEQQHRPRGINTHATLPMPL
jgi:hypothetical protein